MPHYITEDDEDDPGYFFIYSTIVDAPVSDHMDATTMHRFLIDSKANPTRTNYGAWTDPEHPNFTSAIKMHWHPNGFWFVRQSDCYYTLPKPYWRDNE